MRLINIKLIASDLDGTLLLNGAQDLQPYTCGLIRRLREKGILFFAASGRQYYNLRNLFAPIKDIIGYICENGCLNFWEGRRLSKHTLDHETAQKIIRAVVEREGFEVMVSGENVCYIQPKDMAFYNHLKETVKYDVVIVPDIFSLSEDCLKVAVYQKEGRTDFHYWYERLSGLCDVVTSGTEWIDFMPYGVHKGLALRNVLDVLGIDPSECMAIGDNFNDKEMLELAGYSAAVMSAKPEIRSLAKITTDRVENIFIRLLQDDL